MRELSHLEQLETLSDPQRSPKEWQLATAYLGLVPRDIDPELPGDTDWHPVDDLPALAFDHASIVLDGARAAAREALLHESRLRTSAGRVRDLRAP